MNIVDIIILISLVYSILQGLWKGLVSQVVDLAVLVFALAAALTFGTKAAQIIDRVLALPIIYQSLIGSIVVFSAVGLILRPILRAVGSIISGALTATPINRLLGVIPAAAQTILILAIIFEIILAAPNWPQAQSAIKEARFSAPVLLIGKSLETIIRDRVLPEVTNQIKDKL